MRRAILAAMVVGLAGPALAQMPTPAPTSPLAGVWMNPSHSVAVVTEPCGGAMCGRVVWANAHAQADVRSETPTKPLIGTQLLSAFRPASKGMWEGVLYVPDMDRTVSSRIQMIDASTLRISGCLIHGFLCRSQTWQRIDHLPAD
jgi:uncharacterized protein (DUF2147 family)